MRGLIITMLIAGTTTSSPPVVVKVPAAAGDEFLTDPATRHGVVAGAKTQWRELLQSGDKRFSAGIYRSEAVQTTIDSYPMDEFMHLLSGTLTLTSADGTVIKAGPGDVLLVKRGWKGRWDTQGYVKHYVSYHVQ